MQLILTQLINLISNTNLIKMFNCHCTQRTLRVDESDQRVSTMHHNLLHRPTTRTSSVLKVQFKLISVELFGHAVDQHCPR